MVDINDERIRMLVKISQLYYEEGLNQQDIAQRLGISRPHVSRMLTAARTEGIVQISIRNPYSMEQEVERQLVEKFGIRDALIVEVQDNDEVTRTMQLGRACAALLESMVKDNDIVGIMAGRSVQSLASATEYYSRNNLQFVSLVGGYGAEGATWHANANTSTMAEKLRSKYWLLHAPAVVDSEEAAEFLKKEPQIAMVLQKAECCTIAVVGIGQVSGEATIMQAGAFRLDELQEVRDLGAVSNICASFLGSDGRIIPYQSSRRMIGISAQHLRGIPNVIGIAGGMEKVEAIAAALNGQWIDILVTDLATAQAVLALESKRVI
ncbi:sugar-binding transcriptional regulator [Paenibacillus sp. HN-1]|uniref:sugar-binding transcriptional regulator n=1 Tax=Paenibacillus TaxID=44249 RepID=UPI001CA7FC21|nr:MULTISPECIES: sugar-binding transcriptional regulator [Paenibacillus]MBY9080209.1 sugar-binding transcriptional regulator [Paenibacillus sp. CGMCC 1.18879]MBY9083132.1 sugar-binding transcriptional regulator [Paenibacillus sinensis]